MTYVLRTELFWYRQKIGNQSYESTAIVKSSSALWVMTTFLTIRLDLTSHLPVATIQLVDSHQALHHQLVFLLVSLQVEFLAIQHLEDTMRHLVDSSSQCHLQVDCPTMDSRPLLCHHLQVHHQLHTHPATTHQHSLQHLRSNRQLRHPLQLQHLAATTQA